METKTFETRDEVYAFIHATAQHLDPTSRYKSELMQFIDGCMTPADIEAKLDTVPNRGRSFAGDAWNTMSLEEKLTCNLITNETEPHRFTPSEFSFFKETLVPHLQGCAEQTGASAHVLSLPCSTGVEVYTLAGFFLEQGLTDFQIEGKDVLSSAVHQARTGTFPYPGCPGHMVVKLDASIMDRLSFDVLDVTRMPLNHQYDAIFHRNLLAYFEPETARQVLETLLQALRVGGFIIFERFVVDEKYPELFSARRDLSRVGALPIFRKMTSDADRWWFFDSQ